jgi:hypothetical protein
VNPHTKIPAAPAYGARRGTPVVRDEDRGVILRIGNDDGRISWAVAYIDGEGCDDGLCWGRGVTPGDAGWYIDLTDATGRAHVAWAVSEQQRPGHGAQAAFRRVGTSWGIGYPDSATGIRFTVEGKWCASVPSLADLDPNEGTRLPDGSRRVDAEALARVAVCVLGGAK